MDESGEEILRHIIITWAFCASRGVGRETGRGVNNASKTTTFLKRLWLMRVKGVDDLPDNAPDAKFGYVTDLRCIWLRLEKFGEWINGQWKTPYLFYGRDSFCQRLLEAWDDGAYEELLAGTKEFEQLIGDQRFVAWANKEGVFAPNDRCRLDGIVFSGFEPRTGIVWIGYRDQAVVPKLLKRRDDPDKEVQAWRALLLQEPLTKYRIGPVPDVRAPLPWWDQTAVTDEMLRRDFVPICRDLFGGNTTTNPDCHQLERSTCGIEPPAIIAYGNDAAPATISEILAGAKAPLRNADANTLVLCLPETSDKIQATLNNEAIIKTGYSKVRILVLGLDHLPALLSRAPWVWSKHLGSDATCHIVKNDRQHLERVLFGRELTESERARLVPHPQLRWGKLPRGHVRQIRGLPHGGKTTAAYHLLVQQTNWTAAIVPPITEEDIPHCLAMIDTATNEDLMVVVIENAHTWRPTAQRLLDALKLRSEIAVVLTSETPFPTPDDSKWSIRLDRMGEDRLWGSDVRYLSELVMAQAGKEVLLYLRCDPMPLWAYYCQIHEGTTTLGALTTWLRELEAQRKEAIPKFHAERSIREAQLVAASEAAPGITYERPEQVVEGTLRTGALVAYDEQVRSEWRSRRQWLNWFDNLPILDLLRELAHCYALLLPVDALTNTIAEMLVMSHDEANVSLEHLERHGWLTRVNDEYALNRTVLMDEEDSLQGAVWSSATRLLDRLARAAKDHHLRANATIAFVERGAYEEAREQARAMIVENKDDRFLTVLVMFLPHRYNPDAFIDDLIAAPVSAEQRIGLLVQCAIYATTPMGWVALEVTSRNIDRRLESMPLRNLLAPFDNQWSGVAEKVCEALSRALSNSPLLSNGDVLTILRNIVKTVPVPTGELFVTSVQRSWTIAEKRLHAQVRQLVEQRWNLRDDREDAPASFAELFGTDSSLDSE